MRKRPGSRSKWKNFRNHLLLSGGMAIGLSCSSQPARATGYYEPRQYLEEGGKAVDATPEFYWELEVKRLARDFHPTEKLVVFPRPDETSDEEPTEAAFRQQVTAEVDLKDFAQALKEGRIKPPDPTVARQQQETARKFLNSSGVPGSLEEFPSEFSDYHRGALAFRQEHWEDARSIWESILKRPAEERHYRTVWAVFMLGKLALKNGDPAAVKWFQDTRKLAADGFADSLGMAADSYGWEARSEWKQGHPEKAAPLFLTQLALGDPSAIVSLKALIPDRRPIYGMLNYGEEPPEDQSPEDATKLADDPKTIAALKVAARDPLLRRLVTVHILACDASRAWFEGAIAPGRCARWLAAIQEAHPGKIEDAEYLGWVAYNEGDYKDAEQWLEHANQETPAAHWLRAKLLRRAGKLDESVQQMAKAWQIIRQNDAYTGWHSAGESDDRYLYHESPLWTFEECASGDLGGLRLTRGEFVDALHIFLQANLWNDAAFIAERVLTTDELKKYVDEHADAFPDKEQWQRVRYMLGRRLVRDDRLQEAANYLTPPYDKMLAKYVEALNTGKNPKLPDAQRAKAWFTAAWIARYDGMELMGTEAAPDGFATGGAFEVPDLAQERLKGKYEEISYSDSTETKSSKPISLKTTKDELRRLEKNKVIPDARYHYRFIAADLAMRAAKLLPNNSEELADVINTAGRWVKDRNEKLANQYYNVLEGRAAKTTIGAAVLAKHWFVDDRGPWNEQADTEHKALRKELDLRDPEE